MKKSISLFLILAMVLSMVAFPISAADTATAETVIGDMNSDGSVNSDDALYLLNHTLNSTSYPISQSGDMNADGAVNSDDALYLLNHTLNPGSYPLPEPTKTADMHLAGYLDLTDNSGKFLGHDGYWVGVVPTEEESAAMSGIKNFASAAGYILNNQVFSNTDGDGMMKADMLLYRADDLASIIADLDLTKKADITLTGEVDNSYNVVTSIYFIEDGVAYVTVNVKNPFDASLDYTYTLIGLYNASGAAAAGEKATVTIGGASHVLDTLPALHAYDWKAVEGGVYTWTCAAHSKTKDVTITLGSDVELTPDMTLVGFMDLSGGTYFGHGGYWVGVNPTDSSKKLDNFYNLAQYVADSAYFSANGPAYADMVLYEADDLSAIIANVDTAADPSLTLVGVTDASYEVTAKVYFIETGVAYVTINVKNPYNASVDVTYELIGLYSAAGAAAAGANAKITIGETEHVVSNLPARHAYDWDAVTEGAYTWTCESHDKTKTVEIHVGGYVEVTPDLNLVGYLDLSNGTYLGHQGYWAGVLATTAEELENSSIKNFGAAANYLTQTNVFSANGPMYADMLLYRADDLDAIIAGLDTTEADITLSGATDASFNVVTNIYFIEDGVAYVTINLKSPYDSKLDYTYTLIGLYNASGAAAGEDKTAITIGGTEHVLSALPALHGYNWNAVTTGTYTWTCDTHGSKDVAIVSKKVADPDMHLVGHLDLSNGTYYGHPGYWVGVNPTDGTGLAGFKDLARYVDDTSYISPDGPAYADMLLYEADDLETMIASVDTSVADVVLTGLTDGFYDTTVKVYFIETGVAYVTIETTNAFDKSLTGTYALIGLYHAAGTEAVGASAAVTIKGTTHIVNSLPAMHAYDWDAVVATAYTFNCAADNHGTKTVTIRVDVEENPDPIVANMHLAGYIDLSGGTYYGHPGYWVGVNPTDGTGIGEFYKVAARLNDASFFSATGPAYADMVLYEADDLSAIIANVDTSVVDVVLTGVTDSFFDTTVKVYFLDTGVAYVTVTTKNVLDSKLTASYELIGVYNAAGTAVSEEGVQVTIGETAYVTDNMPALHAYDWDAVTATTYSWNCPAENHGAKSVTIQVDVAENPEVTADMHLAGYIDLTGGIYYGHGGYWVGVNPTDGTGVKNFADPAKYVASSSYFSANGPLYADMALYEADDLNSIISGLDLTTPDITLSGLTDAFFNTTVNIYFIDTGVAYVTINAKNVLDSSLNGSYELIGLYNAAGTTAVATNATVTISNVEHVVDVLPIQHAYNWNAVTTGAYTWTCSVDGSKEVTITRN